MLAAVGIASAGSASEDTLINGLPLGVTGSYTTKDVWRGQDQGNDDLSFGIGADLHVFGIDAATSLDWSSNSNQDEFVFGIGTATDFQLPVLADVTFGAEFNYYSEGTDVVGDVTSELGLGLTKDYGFGVVSVTQFLALDGDNDGYGEVSVDLGEVAPGITATATAGYLLEEFELTHVQVAADLPGVPVPFIGLEVSPFVKGVYVFDDRGGIWAGNDGFVFVGGLSLGRTF